MHKNLHCDEEIVRELTIKKDPVGTTTAKESIQIRISGINLEEKHRIKCERVT